MIRDPNEVAAFENRGGGGQAGAGGAGDDREAVLASITASYFFLRRGLAIIAFVFPVVLWLGADPAHLQTSISAYYHYSPDSAGAGDGAMRDVFVGVLWAIGAFLVLYSGYSKKEDWALNLAGLAAVAIACFPMDWNTLEAGRTLTGKVHFISAAFFFVAIAYVAIFRSGDTLRALKDETMRRRFARVYTLLGVLMVVVPLAEFAIYWLERRPRESYIVLAVEVAGIWIFSAFWLTKSREIALIEKQQAV